MDIDIAQYVDTIMVPSKLRTEDWACEKSVCNSPRGERRLRKRTSRNQNDHKDLRDTIDPPSALEFILQFPESYQGKQRRETDRRGERIGFRKGIPKQKKKLFESCLRIRNTNEFGQPKHGGELFAVTEINYIYELVNHQGTHTIITTATAVMKPRRSARLSTTSMNPSLKTPSKKDIKPTCIRCSAEITCPNLTGLTCSVITVAIPSPTRSGSPSLGSG